MATKPELEEQLLQAQTDLAKVREDLTKMRDIAAKVPSLVAEVAFWNQKTIDMNVMVNALLDKSANAAAQSATAQKATSG